ncbi:unnamed protein product [Rhizophagus irregularis]|nr:unnamed protein product [Rhizophagus irregularis]CAB4494287.1 unnamed protein product [Rhizophagus irregularis]
MEPSIPLLKFVKIRYIEGSVQLVVLVLPKFFTEITHGCLKLSFVHHLSNITGAYAQMLQQILKEQVNNISLFLI